MTSIRDTEEYKNLNDYIAVGLAEGFEEPDNETQVLAAWQYIYDKRLYLHLQGFFGRTVRDLLENGYIEEENE